MKRIRYLAAVFCLLLLLAGCAEMQEVSVAKIAATKNSAPTTTPALPIAAR